MYYAFLYVLICSNYSICKFAYSIIFSKNELCFLSPRASLLVRKLPTKFNENFAIQFTLKEQNIYTSQNSFRILQIPVLFSRALISENRNKKSPCEHHFSKHFFTWGLAVIWREVSGF